MPPAKPVVMEIVDFVPPAVRRHADRSNQLVEQQARLRAGATENAPQDPPQDPPHDAPQPLDPPQDPPQDPTFRSNQPDDADHRFNSMKGRYEKSEQKATQLSQQVQELHRVIATLNSAPVGPAPDNQPARSDVTFNRLVTPAEEVEYGAELLDVVGRRARESISPEVQALKDQLAQLQRQMGGVSQSIVQTARERMHEELTAALPNWQQINGDPKFLEWLGLTDSYSGFIRQNMLRHAYERNETSRVLAFFNGFLADEAVTSPGRVPAVAPGSKTPAVDLGALAAPGRARQAASPLPPEKPTFTRAQISQFYRDVVAGYYLGKDDEKAAKEADIYAAVQSGRVT